MSFLRSRRGVLLACFGLLMVLFLFRPGAARLKNRLANSISQALQRQVEIGSVHVHLLPSPGFDLENFVVYDDPAFSAEPMLRAQEVSASVRLLALLRARLEISRLSLTEPSLNLARNDQGRWNITTILEHTAATPAGPTGKGGSASHPEFPYIEADRGRINFKFGSEKKPFALSDATYSVWQDSDTTWGMRIRAVPLRTDFNLSDTGMLRASGTWERAPSFRETPLQFTALWERAQLGQVTKLISGADRGWRGTVRVQTNFSGTPASLMMAAEASVEDFRRYDLAGRDPLHLATHCEGTYSANDGELRNINCSSPSGTGRITLTGIVQSLKKPLRYDLAIRAEAVPLPALLAAARRSKKGLPSDLEATGSLTFRSTFKSDASANHPLHVEGSGSIQDLVLRSASNKTELVAGEVPLLFTAGPDAPGENKHTALAARKTADDTDLPRVMVGPVHLEHATALAIQGSLTPRGYHFSAAGEAGVQRVLRMARVLGLSGVSPIADGEAKLDLAVAGDWHGFAPAQINGTAQLKVTRLELLGLGGPIEIGSATMRLTSDQAEVTALSANAAGSHWTGSLALPRACPSVVECPVTFNLQADELSAAHLRSFLNPTHPTPWYRFLTPETNPGSPWLHQLHASGRLSAGKLVVLNLTASHVAAIATLTEGKLHLANLTADVLGGKHSGTWEADFTTQPPEYSGAGDFKQVALAQLAAAMHDPWLTGTGSGEYQVEAHGATAPELFTLTGGHVHFNLQAGTLDHVVVEGAPMKWRRFSGTLTLKNGLFELADGKLDSASSAYTVSGMATWTRALDFKLVSETAPKMTITGTLAAPHVSPTSASATQATLAH